MGAKLVILIITKSLFLQDIFVVLHLKKETLKLVTSKAWHPKFKLTVNPTWIKSIPAFNTHTKKEKRKKKFTKSASN